MSVPPAVSPWRRTRRAFFIQRSMPRPVSAAGSAKRYVRSSIRGRTGPLTRPPGSFSTEGRPSAGRARRAEPLRPSPAMSWRGAASSSEPPLTKSSASITGVWRRGGTSQPSAAANMCRATPGPASARSGTCCRRAGWSATAGHPARSRACWAICKSLMKTS